MIHNEDIKSLETLDLNNLKVCKLKKLGNIKFGFILLDKAKVFIKLPKCSVSGIMAFNETSDMTMDIQLSDDDREKIKTLEATIFEELSHVHDIHHLNKSSTVKETGFRVKLGKNKELGYSFSVYSDEDDSEILITCDQHLKDIVPPRSEIVSIVHLTGVWCSETSCGLSWKFLQLKVFPALPEQEEESDELETPSGYAFSDSEESEISDQDI